MSSYSYGYSWEYILFLLGIIGVCVALLLVPATINPIDLSEAAIRFSELSGGADVTVVIHSNNDIFFGNSHDVVFELLVDGKPASGRCISGAFSPMVCTIYK